MSTFQILPAVAPRRQEKWAPISSDCSFTVRFKETPHKRSTILLLRGVGRGRELEDFKKQNAAEP